MNIKYSKEQVIEMLRIFVSKNMRYPLLKDCNIQNNLPSYRTLHRYCPAFHKTNILENEYGRNPKLCLNCEKSISFQKRITNKFCGHSCATTFNNNKRFELKLIVNKNNCLNCNKPYLKSKKDSMFCSYNCKREHHWEKLRLLWNEGKLKYNKQLKFFIIERDGYKCSSCDIFEWNGKPLTLHVEHKDGNHENNNPSNLCFLCPNCHSQTDTFGSKNLGNGRITKKKNLKTI
jgi:hypothetical protein